MKPEARLPPADYAAEHPVLASPVETRALDHLPQLDGVRAIAVLMVLWFHFTPDVARIAGGPPWGAIGVGLFFTLSGFLITRILLKCRLKMEAAAVTFGRSIRQFYARRFLRIFPLYYAVLLILFFFNPTDIRQRAWWDLLYLTNVRFSYWPRGGGEIERHLWSLSVEEQFYLIWPVLMLLTPRRILPWLVAATTLAGVAWRAETYVPHYQIHEWMMPACLDLLGGGALLAILNMPQFGLSRWRDAFVQLCGIVGIPLLLFFIGQRLHAVPDARGRLVASGFEWLGVGGATYPITALASVWLIGCAARGFRGPLGWFLTFAPLVYVGRISYGLYVIHMFVPHALGYFFPVFLNGPRTWGVVAVLVAVSVAAASVSWFAFEAPINGLKRYFEYDRKDSAKAATSA